MERTLSNDEYRDLHNLRLCLERAVGDTRILHSACFGEDASGYHYDNGINKSCNEANNITT